MFHVNNEHCLLLYPHSFKLHLRLQVTFYTSFQAYMNIPAITCAIRTLANPTLCLPHASIPNLSHLPIPISRAFVDSSSKEPDIRAVVLDKDNTFAIPKANTVHPSYSTIVSKLIEHYGANRLLIVSNTAGLSSKDPVGQDAAALEKETGIPVLLHEARKPGSACGNAALEHFRAQGIDASPEHVVVIGDRLFTDVVMAKSMGAWSIWIKEGVQPDTGSWTRAEWAIERWLSRRGWTAEVPGR